MNQKFQGVLIIDQDDMGRGIAKVQEIGKPIFVYRALPGEVCDIEIIRNTKKYMEAIVSSKESSKSIQTCCCYYPNCGGCHLLHQKYEEQLQFKEKKVQRILKKFADIDISVQPIVYGEPYFYRNKITLHNLGLYQFKTNESILIKECKIVDERMNKIIERLQKFSEAMNCVIEKAVIRISSLGECLIDVSGNFSSNKFLKNFQDIDVIVINQKKFTEKRFIVDQLFDKRFQISSSSFYQVNRFVTSKLYGLVIDVFQKKKVQNVLDLYCGTGTISILISPYVTHVTGIEVVSDAIIDANDNKDINEIKNVDFICGRVEDYINQFHKMDAIIIDPPRVGLDLKTLQSILEIYPEIIVYVSCDPVTLARDLKKLKESYDIEKIIPVDMFPNTYHVECVCVLNRR